VQTVNLLSSRFYLSFLFGKPFLVDGKPWVFLVDHGKAGECRLMGG
jgi:hypothetical protein